MTLLGHGRGAAPSVWMLTWALVAGAWAGAWAQQRPVNLPSSKTLGTVPGNPKRVNSLPMSMAVSPDGRYVVTVNAGYGTFESKYDQSLAVMDTRTGVVTDFPDPRTGTDESQTLYSGLAFSHDGRHVYVSMASLSDPVTDGDALTGNAIAVYSFTDGKIVPERLITIPLQKLAGARRTKLIDEKDGDLGVPFPAAIALLSEDSGQAIMGNDFINPGGWHLMLVADNLSDDVLLIDADSGKAIHRFDLSESDAVPSTYPIALAVSKDGRRAYVALWNSSEVVELNLFSDTVRRKLTLMRPADPLKPGTHPCDLVMSPDGRTLYVALANRDAVAAIDVAGSIPTSGYKAARHGVPRFAVKGYFDTRLPGQSYFGAEPDALALNADGTRLYVGNMGSDAVAVIDTRKLTAATTKQGMVEPIGFVPTEWMPISMALSGTGANAKLYVATAKGRGTGPNNFKPRIAEGMKKDTRAFTYIPTLLYGSLATLDVAAIERDLPKYTAEVLESNRMKAGEEKIEFGGATKADPSAALRDDKGKGGDDKKSGPIKHIVYIIKENRTYDQLFGDLKKDGKPIGNGDPSLTMYGAEITPNQHRMALQFGVLDNFFDSGEVSGDGHVWSNAAIGTDYLEKTWQQDYRNGQRTYDYEGMVANGYPIQQRIPDVNEPSSGYMWGNADAHGRTHYNFGEFISTTFCNEKGVKPSTEGPVIEGVHCNPGVIEPGGAIPAEWGGGVNRWPWEIPLIARNVATKPELVGHFAPEGPDFNLRVPDQIRVNVFLKHLGGWIADRAAGHDTMPNYITMRLGNDHTSGTTAGGPTPKSLVADNDLAIGRAVDAISHSAYWDDTAFFILEDDAQNAGDHVDAHRSMALVVSKYAPHAANGGVFVDSRFYSTVSVVRTMETLLGLPPMNNNDALASMIGSEFTGPGDQAPFAVDYVNRDNGLIYMANLKTAVGAKESSKMDFTHEDRAPVQKLNVILWRDAMGDKPVPAQLTQKVKKSKKDDDDD